MKEKYNKDVEGASKTEIKAAKETVRKKTSAALPLIGANCERYGKIKTISTKTWLWLQTIIQAQMMKP